MKRNLLMFLGVMLAAAAVALPFVGLERFHGDAAPVLAGFAVLALGIGFGVAAMRPAALEMYARSAAMVFVLLAVISAFGLITDRGSGISTAEAAAFPFGAAGVPLTPGLE